MSDNLTEGNLVEQEAQDANLGSSEGQGQPSDDSLSGLTATVDRLVKLVEAQDGEIRALKSGKDKAVDRVEKSVSQVLPSLEKLSQYLGLEPAQVMDAQRKMVLDDLVQERIGKGQSEPAPAGTGSVSDNTGEIDVYARSLELPANDPRVTELRTKFASDPQGFLKAGVALKVELAKAPQGATPGESITPQGRSAPADKSVEALTADYQKDMVAAQGDPSRARAIKAEYAKKGVPVDSVVFH